MKVKREVVLGGSQQQEASRAQWGLLEGTAGIWAEDDYTRNGSIRCGDMHPEEGNICCRGV